MAPITALTRVFFKYKVFGVLAMDIGESPSALGALAAGVSPTTIATRHVTITRASDNTAHLVAYDNIAGYQDKSIATDVP